MCKHGVLKHKLTTFILLLTTYFLPKNILEKVYFKFILLTIQKGSSILSILYLASILMPMQWYYICKCGISILHETKLVNFVVHKL